MRPLLLALLLTACRTGGLPPPDERVAGVDVWWGAQVPDAVGLAMELDRCDVRLTQLARAGLLRDARVAFVEEADGECDQRNVAGCWLPEMDLAIVEARPSVEMTAACHELVHRARAVLGMDVDYAHADAAWWGR